MLSCIGLGEGHVEKPLEPCELRPASCNVVQVFVGSFVLVCVSADRKSLLRLAIENSLRELCCKGMATQGQHLQLSTVYLKGPSAKKVGFYLGPKMHFLNGFRS